MDITEAKKWLLEVDGLCGAGFHVDNPASEYDPPMSAEFEENRLAFCELARTEEFDPYDFAMRHMPSFQRLNPLWKREHGSEFTIPEDLEAALIAAGFVDESWHNDVCPVFRKESVANILMEVWCDHPKPEDRELKGVKRFVVNVVGKATTGADRFESYNVLLATDDATEVVRFIGQ